MPVKRLVLFGLLMAIIAVIAAVHRTVKAPSAAPARSVEVFDPRDVPSGICTSTDGTIVVVIHGLLQCEEWDRIESGPGSFWQPTSPETVGRTFCDLGKGKSLIEVSGEKDDVAGEEGDGLSICGSLVHLGWVETGPWPN